MTKIIPSLLISLFFAGVSQAHSPTEARDESYRSADAGSPAFLRQLASRPGGLPTSVGTAPLPAWVKSTLSDWVVTNSGSFNFAGLESMRAKVKPLFTALGYTATEVEVGEVTDPKGNKFVRKILVFDFPGSKPDVLILGHLDTVFELSHPFQAFSEDGAKWKGPGASDMKGGLILAAHTLSVLKDPSLLKRVRIVINDDEEQGSRTSGPFLKKYAEQATAGLIFEASTDSDVTSSHSGLLWFETTVFGVASHAGAAHASGVSACLDSSYKMIEMYRLLDYSRGLTINAGIVNTPDRAKTNTVCDEIKTSYDVRFVDFSDIARTRNMFSSVMAQNFAPNPSGATVPASVVKEVQFTPSMPPEKSKTLVDIYFAAALKLGVTATAKHKGAVDAYGVIEAPLGLISGLGPYGGGFHSDKEFLQSDVYMRKLDLNVAFMRELLK